jgi:hypothetical protein
MDAARMAGCKVVKPANVRESRSPFGLTVCPFRSYHQDASCRRSGGVQCLSDNGPATRDDYRLLIIYATRYCHFRVHRLDWA